MSEQFKHYIKAIGRGQRSGRYLSQAEAFDAMQLIMQEQVTAEQLGAFLMLLRVREENEDELAGFVQAIRQTTLIEYQRITGVDLDLGCYAGKRRHLPWFILAVKVLAENGYRVLLHGTTEPESERLYIKRIFQYYDWPMAQSANQVEALLEQNNYTYIDLVHIHPNLDKLIQLRQLFGLRSAANSLARMLNPTSAAFSFHGVFHKGFDHRHALVADLLGDKGVACLRGEGGEVELNPERDAVLCFNNLQQRVLPALLTKRQVKSRHLSPGDLKAFWQNETIDLAEYALASVTGTLACYLCLLDGLNAEEALVKAKQLWQQRNVNHF